MSFSNKHTQCCHPYIIGDTYIQNCKICGIFIPKLGGFTIRKQDKNYECDFFVSDFLREFYSTSMKRPFIILH